ncbi:MAG: hypothetical protein GXY87_00550 [Tissierellia bacterium]|nr:hypothetical protein [Tissierellia bacterium]
MKKIIFALIGAVVGLLIGKLLDNSLIGYIVAAVLAVLGYVFSGSIGEPVEEPITPRTGNTNSEPVSDVVVNPIPTGERVAHDPLTASAIVNDPIEEPVIEESTQEDLKPLNLDEKLVKKEDSMFGEDGLELSFKVDKPGEDFTLKSPNNVKNLVDENPKDVEYDLDDFPKLGPDNELILDDEVDREEVEEEITKFKADKYVEGQEPIERKDIIEGRDELIDRTIIDGEVDRR